MRAKKVNRTGIIYLEKLASGTEKNLSNKMKSSPFDYDAYNMMYSRNISGCLKQENKVNQIRHLRYQQKGPVVQLIDLYTSSFSSLVSVIHSYVE